MSRLIETAGAIQAVKDCRNCKHGKYNDYHDTYFCYNAEDCNNWDKWETSAQPEVLAHGEGELKEFEPQWIPVSERLPEENEFYLSTIYSKGMQTAFCDILFYGAPQLCGDSKIGWYFMHHGAMEQVFNVTAWMPLPKPFEGVEE